MKARRPASHARDATQQTVDMSRSAPSGSREVTAQQRTRTHARTQPAAFIGARTDRGDRSHTAIISDARPAGRQRRKHGRDEDERPRRGQPRQPQSTGQAALPSRAPDRTQEYKTARTSPLLVLRWRLGPDRPRPVSGVPPAPGPDKRGLGRPPRRPRRSLAPPVCQSLTPQHPPPFALLPAAALPPSCLCFARYGYGGTGIHSDIESGSAAQRARTRQRQSLSLSLSLSLLSRSLLGVQFNAQRSRAAASFFSLHHWLELSHSMPARS
jgi:hypothetical protein